jgi:hypothetical protein
MFQGKRPLRTASPSCERVEEVELSVNVQLTPPNPLFSTTPARANKVKPLLQQFTIGQALNPTGLLHVPEVAELSLDPNPTGSIFKCDVLPYCRAEHKSTHKSLVELYVKSLKCTLLPSL